ncbi:MAG: serine/threonine protein kinase [Deltaproteobacteria bacterium]|nr:serine/threonine protein kinase [Deltaproteobacteria bacterium]
MGAEQGRYQVLFDLAAGGMGVVSVAQLRGEHGFRRTVAAKRIHGHLAADRRVYEQLVREARLAAQIRDPGIVQVHELVEQDGELLIAMELVEGTSLRELLVAIGARNELVPLAVAVRILAKVARALHAAHTTRDESGRPLGIVHRDISPQNVLLSFGGDVKVTDFGIATAVATSSAKTTGVRGKPGYVAPEQLRNEPVDARTDVWALGVVGYEMLSGTRLFRGRNDLETIRLMLEAKVPRLDEVRPDVPKELADAVARAISRDAWARWPTALDFARAIEGTLRPEWRATGDDVAALVRRLMPGADRALAQKIRRALETPSPKRRDQPAKRSALRLVLALAAGLVLGFGGRVVVRAATRALGSETPVAATSAPSPLAVPRAPAPPESAPAELPSPAQPMLVPEPPLASAPAPPAVTLTPQAPTPVDPPAQGLPPSGAPTSAPSGPATPSASPPPPRTPTAQPGIDPLGPARRLPNVVPGLGELAPAPDTPRRRRPDRPTVRGPDAPVRPPVLTEFPL